MLKFYDVNDEYVKYLKTVDDKIPDVKYDKNNKFVCGIVLEINGINYYAPISHFNKPQRTNLPIYDKKERVIATIRFCFMFPAPLSVLTIKDFSKIGLYDKKYSDLLLNEYTYCKKIEKQIYEKALAVYKIGCNPNHVFYDTCCKFINLESAYLKYINAKIRAGGFYLQLLFSTNNV
ncbi:MAG: type III toxin-antitoxin system ToxN/AbiQ family toxin [Eubacteriales bacterium]